MEAQESLTCSWDFKHLSPDSSLHDKQRQGRACAHRHTGTWLSINRPAHTHRNMYTHDQFVDLYEPKHKCGRLGTNC